MLAIWPAILFCTVPSLPVFLPVSWTHSLCVTSKQSHTDQPRSEVQNRKVETQENRSCISISEKVPDTPAHRQTATHSETKAERLKVDRHREKLRDERYTLLVKWSHRPPISLQAMERYGPKVRLPSPTPQGCFSYKGLLIPIKQE